MFNRTKRNELGKHFYDIAKYILTVVLIGKLFAPMPVSVWVIILAIITSVVFGLFGYLIIPKDKE